MKGLEFLIFKEDPFPSGLKLSYFEKQNYPKLQMHFATAHTKSGLALIQGHTNELLCVLT